MGFILGNAAKADCAGEGSTPSLMNTIDFLDTIYFDLSNTIVNASTIEFPVYFFSDDTVNALDFAMRFDLSKIAYDSLINPTPFLNAFAFYNVNDSTLRFTSYTLNPMTNGQPLVRLRFRIVSGSFGPADLFPQETYLNGEPCSWKVNDYIGLGVWGQLDLPSVKIYPSLTTGRVRLELLEAGKVRVFSPDFNEVAVPIIREEKGMEINLDQLPSGTYLVLVETNGGLIRQRVVLVH